MSPVPCPLTCLTLAAALFGATPKASIFEGAPVRTLLVRPGADVRPAARRPGRTVADWLAAEGGVAAINGGYFNHSDGWPVSHVAINGLEITKPEANRALRGNPVLSPHLGTILRARSAWFAVPDGWRITRWDTPPLRWRHALQAGPALLPDPALAAEAFVLPPQGGRPARDGIASTARAPRSALGLRRGGPMVLAVVGAPGLSIAGLARLMAHLGCERALALDGGSSSTLAWREGGRVRSFVGSGRAPALVNSVLVVKP